MEFYFFFKINLTKKKYARALAKNTYIDENNRNKCINCNKIFTRTDNYNRHILYRCKKIDETIKKDDTKNMIELLTKINERQIKMDKKYEMLYNKDKK